MSLAEDKAPSPENSSEEASLGFLAPDYWYEHAVGRPQPPSKHVAIVIIGKDLPRIVKKKMVFPPEEFHPEACKRRVYLAALLKALSNLRPKVVAVDMWLDPDSCSDDEANQDLFEELGEITKQVPVVFGLGTYNPSEILSGWPAEFADVRNRKPGLKRTELVQMPILHPTRPGNGNITEGVVELNSDTRKIPLSWPVYDRFASVGENGQPRRLDSLSVAAVRAFDPQGEILKKINALNPDGSPEASPDHHPYTSFLREDELLIIRGNEIICFNPVDAVWKDACRSVEKTVHSLAGVTGKTVLIGLAGLGSDVHRSLIGNVPGVILQANYVESLLDDRVFKPVPVIYQIVIGGLWLFVIFGISYSYRSHPGLAVLWSLFAALIPAYLIRLCILHFGYYTQTLAPVILSAIVITIGRQIEHLIDRQEERP